MQNRLDFLNGFLGEVVQFQEHRTGTRLQLLEKLQHHLAGPVVTFDEALTKGVRREATQWAGDVGAGRAVVVFQKRIDLEAFEVREVRAGVIGHGMAITVVGGVLVGAEQVTGGWQAEAAGCASGHDYGFGADDDRLGGSGIDADHARDLAVGVFQKTSRGEAVLDLDPITAKAAIQNLFDVVAFRHGQDIGAQVVHLFHVVIAGFIFLEVHPPGIQLLDHWERAGGIGHQGRLMHNTVVGDGDFLDVLFRCRMARHNGVVQTVHAH